MYKISDLEDLHIDPNTPVFVDTETGGENYSSVVTVQVYQEGWSEVKVFIIAELPSFALDFIWQLISKATMVGHNYTYDLQQFKNHGVLTHDYHFVDTFYAARLVYPEWGEFSLDKCLTKVLGYDPYAKEGLSKKDMQMSFSPHEHPTHSQLVYASVDVLQLPKLYHAVESIFDDFVYKLDIVTVKHIMTDVKGMPVDTDELLKLEQADIKETTEVTKALKGLNCNSYMQVRRALGTVFSSDELALQIIKHRPEGLTGLWARVKMTNGKFPKAVLNGIDEGTIRCQTRNFGKATEVTSSSLLPKKSKTLVYCMETDYVHANKVMELADLVHRNRKALKRLNFVKRARIAMDEDSRISATFSAHARNGRIQQDDENLTQFPRSMKAMWGHKKGSGRKLLYSDFAQIELRIICAALPEMNMYKALKEGKDLHSFVADSFNFSEREKALLPAGQTPRQVAKQANFLLLYGGGIANFQKIVCRNSGVWFSGDMCEAIVGKWKSIFSDISLWHKKNSKSVSKMDQTVGGRRYKANLVTDLNNIKVSGTGAEVFKLWLDYIQKYLMPHLPDSYMVNRVHDAVYIDIPDEPAIYEPAATFLAKLAQKAWFDITAKAALTDVPMPCDAGVGSNLAGIDYGYDVDFTTTLDPYYMLDKEIKDEEEAFIRILNKRS